MPTLETIVVNGNGKDVTRVAAADEGSTSSSSAAAVQTVPRVSVTPPNESKRRQGTKSGSGPSTPMKKAQPSIASFFKRNSPSASKKVKTTKHCTKTTMVRTATPNQKSQESKSMSGQSRTDKPASCTTMGLSNKDTAATSTSTDGLSTAAATTKLVSKETSGPQKDPSNTVTAKKQGSLPVRNVLAVTELKDAVLRRPGQAQDKTHCGPSLTDQSVQNLAKRPTAGTDKESSIANETRQSQPQLQENGNKETTMTTTTTTKKKKKKNEKKNEKKNKSKSTDATANTTGILKPTERDVSCTADGQAPSAKNNNAMESLPTHRPEATRTAESPLAVAVVSNEKDSTRIQASAEKLASSRDDKDKPMEATAESTLMPSAPVGVLPPSDDGPTNADECVDTNAADSDMPTLSPKEAPEGECGKEKGNGNNHVSTTTTTTTKPPPTRTETETSDERSGKTRTNPHKDDSVTKNKLVPTNDHDDCPLAEPSTPDDDNRVEIETEITAARSSSTNCNDAEPKVETKSPSVAEGTSPPARNDPNVHKRRLRSGDPKPKQTTNGGPMVAEGTDPEKKEGAEKDIVIDPKVVVIEVDALAIVEEKWSRALGGIKKGRKGRGNGSHNDNDEGFDLTMEIPPLSEARLEALKKNEAATTRATARLKDLATRCQEGMKEELFDLPEPTTVKVDVSGFNDPNSALEEAFPMLAVCVQNR